MNKYNVKRVLFTILFVLLSLTLMGQSKSNKVYHVPDPRYTPVINITHNAVANGWALMGQTCAGCASYYYAITRTTNSVLAEDGRMYYYYFFYFYSNSYYSNGQYASTYLQDADFYLNGTFVLNTPYILATGESRYYAAWIRSPMPNAQVSFQIRSMWVH